ncbi:MAG: hypothetical protein R3C32_07690 [Chloroflexota bacterium]
MARPRRPRPFPWLLRLDKYVDGQSMRRRDRHRGPLNGSETALNEAVALNFLADAGLASQKAVASGFSVNGRPVLRLVIEDPEDHWMAENFEGAKAPCTRPSTGDWSIPRRRRRPMTRSSTRRRAMTTSPT